MSRILKTRDCPRVCEFQGLRLFPSSAFASYLCRISNHGDLCSEFSYIGLQSIDFLDGIKKARISFHAGNVIFNDGGIGFDTCNIGFYGIHS